MVRYFAGAALVALAAGAAQADTLNLHDESGAAVTVDTASVQGCTMVFDSSGAAFELCRLEKVELRPPQSTRARPGQAAQGDEPATVIYTKTTD